MNLKSSRMPLRDAWGAMLMLREARVSQLYRSNTIIVGLACSTTCCPIPCHQVNCGSSSCELLPAKCELLPACLSINSTQHPWSQAVNISAVKPSKPTVTSSASLGFFDRRRLGLSFRSPGPVLPRTAARKARNRDPGALPGHVCGGPPSSVHPSAASCLRSAFRTQRSARGFRRRFRRLGFGCPRKFKPQAV